MAVRVKDRIEGNIRQSDKVNNSLSIQLNSGTATIYDGSASKSINITASSVGAPSKTGSGASGTWNITSASTQRLLSLDTRSTSIIPTETLTGLVADFKVKGTVGITASGSYVGVLTWRSYSTAADLSGGQPIQIAYTQDNELQTRLGNTSTWGSWTKLLNSNNYTTYTVKKDGTGATGTWGINITGSSATCTGKAATATRLLDNGNHTEIASGTTANKPSTGMLYSSGLYMTKTYQDSATPVNYGNIINIAGSGTGQLLCEWSGIDNTPGHLYYRSHRDTSSGGWAPWVKILDDNNYSSITDSRYLKLSGGTLTGLLTISTNGKYVTLGCQNNSYAHYTTNASNGHWFNTNVHVQGNIYCGSSYNTLVLTTAGGTLNNTAQIIRNGRSTSWITGRDTAIIRVNTYNNYSAGLSMKTTNGSWEIGVYTSNNLWFTYASDANYNAGTNTVTQFHASPAGVIYGAAWNDYAEFRTTVIAKAGEVVVENGDGTMHRSYKRLEPAASIVSDTYGFAIGETEKCGTPIAVAGRVLAYPYEDRYLYKAGDAVCSAPDGKVSKMTREEMVMYPDCIIGYVSEIPEYEVWGQTDVPVNGRIWIKV